MVVVEVYLPSGFEGNQDFNKGGVRGLKYVEPESDHVNFYFDSLDLKDTCFWMTATRIDKVTQSQKIPVIVYDYYHPESVPCWLKRAQDQSPEKSDQLPDRTENRDPVFSDEFKQLRPVMESRCHGWLVCNVRKDTGTKLIRPVPCLVFFG
ncbi:hypothetical protein FSP39_000872 [Pinctada imbricata]|uniref:Alpha-macroglobulin receptor-binding domain-containing protein n=1 Tax=Pinctada imbricata TaxID=66713 RepID=A0AA89C2X4_PINIB|nr:hypothetical protein FSP39_000872 [Pinctada imbricata]